MDEIDRLIRRQIAAELCTGAQVAVAARTGLRTWSAGADGIDQAIDDSTFSALYCASKPILAFAVHALAAAGVMPLTATVGEILGPAAVGAPTATVADLLNHTAGVHSADSETLKFNGHVRKRAIAQQAAPPSGWSSDTDAGYSEYVGWAILAEMVEAEPRLWGLRLGAGPCGPGPRPPRR